MSVSLYCPPTFGEQRIERAVVKQIASTWEKTLAMKFMKFAKLMFLAAVLVSAYPFGVEAQVKQRARRVDPRDRKIKEEAKLKTRLPFISDVFVTPSASNAVISFKSSQRTLPLVEIGRVPAQPDRHGIMTFPVGSSAFTRFVQPQNGRYTLDFNASNEQLEAGTTYYYIINVFNDNQNDPARKREQETGEISTLSQTVKVVFTTITVINDSDDSSTGEISLWFWVNYGRPEAKWSIVENLGDNYADTGQSYDVGSDSALVIENAPNTLTLAVSGVEDDTSLLNGVFGSGSARGTGIGPPLEGPARLKNFEYNVARATFDLTQFRSGLGPTREEFKLVSMPNGGTLGNLSFEVHGYLEITRWAR